MILQHTMTAKLGPPLASCTRGAKPPCRNTSEFDPCAKRARVLGNLREERPDVGVEYEVHLPAADPDDQRVQRVMLAAPWPEPVREPEEIFLVDRAQHCCRGPLADVVLQRRDREWALAAVFLRNVTTPGWQRPVRSAFDPCVQVLNPAIEVRFVGLPRHPAATGRGGALHRVERRSQHR